MGERPKPRCRTPSSSLLFRVSSLLPEDAAGLSPHMDGGVALFSPGGNISRWEGSGTLVAPRGGSCVARARWASAGASLWRAGTGWIPPSSPEVWVLILEFGADLASSSISPDLGDHHLIQLFHAGGVAVPAWSSGWQIWYSRAVRQDSRLCQYDPTTRPGGF